jgi:hypothetical protein
VTEFGRAVAILPFDCVRRAAGRDAPERAFAVFRGARRGGAVRVPEVFLAMWVATPWINAPGAGRSPRPPQQ